jgi:hypothetical protein
VALIVIIEGLLELVAEIVVEIVIQLVGELLVELGIRGASKLATRRNPNPILSAIGYASMGAALGGMSVWLWPQALMSEDLRLVNLIVGPIVAGSMMAVVGALLRRRGKDSIRLESFFYGWLLAFSLSLVRFLAAGSG